MSGEIAPICGSARYYRENMSGDGHAASLPPASDPSARKWEEVAKRLEGVRERLKAAQDKARGNHEGQAAEAADASVGRLTPYVDAAVGTARDTGKLVEEQAEYQRTTYGSLPADGDTLPNGKPAQLDPPDKNWSERNGVDNLPGLGWTSDYEQKRENYTHTIDQARHVTDRYRQQSESVISRAPKFEPLPPPQQPPPPPADNGGTDTSGLSTSSYHSTPDMGSSTSSSSTPSSTSSAWSPSPSTGGSVTPTPSPSPSASGPGPAGSGAAWSQGGNSSLPPGTVRGPDGTLYRQMPDGSWQRQNPYNGRWASSPQGPHGAAGGRGGTGGPRGGGGGAAGPRGGTLGGRPNGGFGPQGSTPKPGSGPLANGGRSGVAPVNGSPSNTTPSTSTGQAGQSGRGAAMRPMGAGGQQAQSSEDEERERPTWLVETEDVFTNDMDKTAPPVIGLAPWEEQG